MEYKIIRKNTKQGSNESPYHRKAKYLLSNILLSQFNHNIHHIITEESIADRRADVFVELHSKQQIAIEIQNSVMSVKELQERTKTYNKNRIFVLWLLNGNGPVCAERKTEEIAQNVKLSTLERHLHYVYGGRVYYLNLENSMKELHLFALHYSCSLKRKYRNKRFKTPYSYYYVMNQDPVRIPGYALLCTQFNNTRLARFYDKNIVYSLMDEIKAFSSTNKTITNKKLLNAIVNYFFKYNRSVLYHAILNLISRNEIAIKSRNIKRSFRKYYCKYQFSHIQYGGENQT